MSETNSNKIILPDVGATPNEPTITAKDIADVKTTIDDVEYTIDKDIDSFDRLFVSNNSELLGSNPKVLNISR